MLENIKKQLLEIYEACRGLSEETVLSATEDPLYEHVTVLNRLVAIDAGDTEVRRLTDDKNLTSAIVHIAALKRTHGLRVERVRAKAVFESANPRKTLEGFIYYPNYLKLAEMESKGASLEPGDRVVFLGSGPLPLSLITMAGKYGLKGVGIEKDPFNADLSRRVIDVLGMREMIEIVVGDHFSLPLECTCSLIMVGSDAIPKDEIFSHLANTLPGGMKISYRVYEKGLRRLFDLDHVLDLPAYLREYRRIQPEPPVNNTSVFVISEKGEKVGDD